MVSVVNNAACYEAGVVTVKGHDVACEGAPLKQKGLRIQPPLS